jgi:hypothetical protein
MNKLKMAGYLTGNGFSQNIVCFACDGWQRLEQGEENACQDQRPLQELCCLAVLAIELVHHTLHW